MTLNKPSGNMYPWAYTWNPIGGKCGHRCGYCYVEGKIAPWMKGMGNDKYMGEPRLIESEFKTKLVVPEGHMVFVESCGDIGGSWIPDLWINRVLDRIENFPETTFLLQSKNPLRFLDFFIPENCILGTTIETNRDYTLTKAPPPKARFQAMKALPNNITTMLSIEPVMDFDLNILLSWVGVLKPKFVSVGADSGKNNLPEPPPFKLKQLLWMMELATEVKRKGNLKRLLEGEGAPQT